MVEAIEPIGHEKSLVLGIPQLPKEGNCGPPNRFLPPVLFFDSDFSVSEACPDEVEGCLWGEFRSFPETGITRHWLAHHKQTNAPELWPICARNRTRSIILVSKLNVS